MFAFVVFDIQTNLEKYFVERSEGKTKSSLARSKMLRQLIKKVNNPGEQKSELYWFVAQPKYRILCFESFVC